MLSVLLASAVVPLTCMLARLVVEDERKALGITAFLVILPELMIDVARISNENIPIILMTAVLLCAVRIAKVPKTWWAWIGMALTLGFAYWQRHTFWSCCPYFC